MRSSSYYLGLFLADSIIYSISNVLLVAFVSFLNLGIFSENAIYLWLILTVLGFPLITLAYLFGFIFDNPETAFKWVFWLALMTYVIPLILITKDVSFLAEDIRNVLSDIFQVLSPFIAFSCALTEIGTVNHHASVMGRIYKYLCYQIIQFVVFISIAILTLAKN